MKKTFKILALILIIFLNHFCKKDDNSSIKDGDGNIYTSVTIGSQIWMDENLKTTKYNDGKPIPIVTEDSKWVNLTTPACCWYNNDALNYKATYGALYNWYAVDRGNICPIGWHVPSNKEWTALETYLIATSHNYDGSIVENKIAKSLAGDINWTSSVNVGVPGNTDYPTKRNSTGFTALPGGNRHFNATFVSIGENGDWWSSTEFNVQNAWSRVMFFNSSSLNSFNLEKGYGFSVRCIKD